MFITLCDFFQTTMSDDEDDYAMQPIGMNTVDRVRRLSGIYTPRPFISNSNAASGPPAAGAQSASHALRPRSAGAVRYNAELNSTDVDLDDLVTRQFDRITDNKEMASISPIVLTIWIRLAKLFCAAHTSG
jgi:hypothetical protein